VVRHETLYRYSVPVVLAPHVLRLTPRSEHRLQSRSLVVRPQPVELREEDDDHGNRVARVTFSGGSSIRSTLDFDLSTTTT
jgi:transglutaminase-like putative cysteine protease